MRSSASIYVGAARASGVGTRHGMEEIRGNTAELDKPAAAGFVLSGVRNEDKRGRLWDRVVVGHRPDYRVSQRTFSCSLARSFARSPVCAEIGNLLTRDRHSVLLTSVAGSMSRNGFSG